MKKYSGFTSEIKSEKKRVKIDGSFFDQYP
jgi:hypothetical protein